MNKKSILFIIIVILFLTTVLITMLGILKIINIDEFYLKGLFAAFILELAAVVYSMTRKANLLEDYDPILINKISPQISFPKIGSEPEILSRKEEKILLSKLIDWDVVESKMDNGGIIRELHRIYEFKDFDSAFHFMNYIANNFIIKNQHHPRWENSYNRLEIWLSTKNANNSITTRDEKMALMFEDVWISCKKGLSVNFLKNK